MPVKEFPVRILYQGTLCMNRKTMQARNRPATVSHATRPSSITYWLNKLILKKKNAKPVAMTTATNAKTSFSVSESLYDDILEFIEWRKITKLILRKFR